MKKFRAWDEEKKEWFYLIVGALPFTGDALEQYIRLSTRGVEWLQLAPLPDADGKEIWEGDFVTADTHDFFNMKDSGETAGHVTMSGKVVFSDGKFIIDEITTELGDVYQTCDADLCLFNNSLRVIEKK